MRSAAGLPRHIVYIGIGSNLGDRERYLAAAVEALRGVSVDGRVRASAVYETEPVGYTEQPRFLNMAVELAVALRPRQLLTRLMDIEQQYGRVRTVRYGPRTLDLDLLLYDNEYVCFADLQIPHPRMWERAFVLTPLADLIPGRRGLGGRSIREMAQSLALEGEVRNVGRLL